MKAITTIIMITIYWHLQSVGNLHFIYLFLFSHQPYKVDTLIYYSHLTDEKTEPHEGRRGSLRRHVAQSPGHWVQPLFPGFTRWGLSGELQARTEAASWETGRQSFLSAPTRPRPRNPASPLTDPGADLWLIRTWIKAQRPLCHCFNEKPITRSLAGGGDEEFGTGVGGGRIFLVTWMIYSCSGQVDGKGSQEAKEKINMHRAS